MRVPPPVQSPLPSELDPAGLAFLMGQVGRFQFKTKAQYRTPPLFSSSSPSSPPPKTRSRQEFDSGLKPEVKIRKSGPAHHLSDLQKISFQFFNELNFVLELDFSVDELKVAFRKLALKFHPDRGGDQKSFILLKSHYDSLRHVFTAEQNDSVAAK